MRKVGLPPAGRGDDVEIALLHGTYGARGDVNRNIHALAHLRSRVGARWSVVGAGLFMHIPIAIALFEAADIAREGRFGA